MDIGQTADTAKQLVTRDRGNEYGHPLEDFSRTVKLYHILKGSNTVDTAEDGILFMVCVKLSREANKHRSDNLVDLAGYADLLNFARGASNQCPVPESVKKA